MAWHSDRLSRHPCDLKEIISVIEGRDLRVHSGTSGEMDLDTLAGRPSARILVLMVRTRSNMKQSVRFGNTFKSPRLGVGKAESFQLDTAELKADA